MRQVEDILEPIISGLVADGAVLSVAAVAGSTLRLHLDTTDACAECIVDDAILEGIVLGHLSTAGADSVDAIEHVEIERAGQADEHVG